MPVTGDGHVQTNGRGRRYVKPGPRVPDEQWEVYSTVIDALQDHGVPFALGGALAMSAYSSHCRKIKDLDLYILREDRDRVVQILESIGMTDYGAVEPYDRGWIYRAHRDGEVIDAIFGMPNRRASCDRSWIEAGPEILIRDRRLRVVPPDRLVWAKIYVLQRLRCDWPDIINILFGAGRAMNWKRLFHSLGDDLPLLRGIMTMFAWLAPGRARAIEPWIWTHLGLPPPEQGPEFIPDRVRLLESRPWFGPLMACEQRNHGATGRQTNSSEESLTC